MFESVFCGFLTVHSKIICNFNLNFSGFLLRILSGSNKEELFKSLTHIMLDEVHERELITDFLLIVIRDAIKMYPHLKVIIMSATLDSEKFSKYFDDCPVVNVPGCSMLTSSISTTFLSTPAMKLMK